MSVVIFNAVEFKAQFPAFAAVDNGFLQSCFTYAGLYLSNNDCSPVQDLDKRKELLYLLTAHIAYVQGALNPGGTSGGAQPVGRLASATEGSVSVSYDFGPVENRQAWYVTSQWGAMYWAATSYLRSFNYRPRPTRY